MKYVLTKSKEIVVFNHRWKVNVLFFFILDFENQRFHPKYLSCYPLKGPNLQVGYRWTTVYKIIKNSSTYSYNSSSGSNTTNLIISYVNISVTVAICLQNEYF